LLCAFFCVKIVAGKNVSVFHQMAVIFEFVLAVLVPCGAVHRHGEKDQDYDFTVLYDIDL